jgi:sortase A
VPAGFAAGWQDTSALLGRAGNTVLNGHHNAHGMVFKDLVKLQEGDLIQVYGGGWKQTFEVAAKLLLPERGQPLDTRLDNARWMEASDDQRLTLVTCWPSESNTHRVIIVAFPVGDPIRQGAPVGSGGE